MTEPTPHQDPFGFDSGEWLTLTLAASQDDPLGALGPYALLEEVARGGQGVVYRACDTRTGAIVAVKRLAEGAFASPSARERLAREIDVVSRLDHPAIPRLLDVESLGSQSLLVLEWVDGVPVTRWAADGPRTARDIVKPFARAAEALLHAHQRGVVHRDLKPSNLLITPGGDPRVLDFGLAKRLDTDESMLTRVGQFVGTPAYASPEQHSGGDAVDVRSDVYSLAVLLFQALSGALPFPGDRAATGEPPRLAGRRDGADRDLDAILRRALACSPGDRYRSMDAFAADLDRWLAGVEIEARWPTTTERLGSAVRGHRWLVAGIASAVVVSLAFGATMGVLRHRADVQAQRAEHVQQFVSSILLPDASGSVSLDARLVDLLENASQRIDRELGQDPAAALRVRQRMVEIYRQLWMWGEAGREAERALPHARLVHGEDSLAEADLLSALALSRAFNADADAADFSRRALGIRRRRLAEEPLAIAGSEANLAFCLWYTSANDNEAVRELYLKSLDTFERASNGASPTWAGTLYSFAAFLVESGRREEALVRFGEAVSQYDQLPADYDQHRIRCLTDLGTTLSAAGRVEEAGPCFERAVREGSSSRADPWTVRAMEGLSAYRELQGRPAEARELLTRTLELQAQLAEPVWDPAILEARRARLAAAP